MQEGRGVGPVFKLGSRHQPKRYAPDNFILDAVEQLKELDLAPLK